MPRRAPRTGYYLNRAVGHLALIARNVRLPDSVGLWLPLADGEPPPWKVAEMVATAYPEFQAERLPFVALMTESEVRDFEEELRVQGLLRPQGGGPDALADD